MGFRVFIAISSLFACALAAGCGPSVDGRYPVRGKVTYNGEPVVSGSIVFVPAESDAKDAIKAGGLITDGMYELPAKLGPRRGTHKVEIIWNKPTGRKLTFDDPPAQVDERVNVIPANFNKETTLTADISNDENVLNFELTGPPINFEGR